MEINWIKQGDDYTAKVGEYRLGVYMINRKYSSSAMKRINLDVFYIQHGFSTPEQAKAAAEQAYLEHIKK